MSLPAILSAAVPRPEGLYAAIPESWAQGRTSYGGLTAALALAGAQRVADDLPPLRSAQVNFVGPLAGEVEVRARTLRRGRNAAWVAAEVHGASGLGTAATFVFMGPVESELHLNESPPPEGLIGPECAIPLPEGRGPGFIGHFDARYALPRAGDREPELCWWVRLKERAGLDPMVEHLAMADALPPGVMPLLRRGPVSSMTWLVNMLTPAPSTDDGWWLIRSRGTYAESGCSSQQMGVWNAHGAPVSSGMQAIAIFG